VRKYPPDPGHGVFDLLEALERLDGATVNAGTGSDPASQTDFDRKVRRSMDRLHRKRVIAER
jgi:hypothetical protein